MTKIDEHAFSLDLPGQWEQIASEQPGTLVYRETAGTGTVTVMLLAVRPAYAIADRRRLLNDYAQHRSKYERGQAPSLEQSEPILKDSVQSVEASWNGVDVATGLQQRHRAVMAQDVLADFCYEISGLDETSFDHRAALILGNASVSVDRTE